MLIEDVFREKIIGGKCGREIPGNMPNPEVKPASVDGTVRGTYGRANRCQFRLQTMRGSSQTGFLFFVRAKKLPADYSAQRRLLKEDFGITVQEKRVGKTILSIILADISLRCNKRVVAIDASGQSNSFFYSYMFYDKRPLYRDLLTIKSNLHKADFNLPCDLMIINCPIDFDAHLIETIAEETDLLRIIPCVDTYFSKRLQGKNSLAVDIPRSCCLSITINILHKKTWFEGLNKEISLPFYGLYSAIEDICKQKTFQQADNTHRTNNSHQQKKLKKSYKNEKHNYYDYYDDPENPDAAILGLR